MIFIKPSCGRFLASTFLSIAATFCPTIGTASIVAQWTYEVNTPPDSTDSATGPTVLADVGTGTSVSVHASALTDWSTPAGNGSANSYSANNWGAGDYFQFQVSTLGFSGITFGWDQTRSGTGPTTFKLEADFGSGFVDIVNPYTVGTTSWSAGTNDPGSVFAAVSLGAAADNLSLLTVRLTSTVAGAAAGTSRVDNVTISSNVPEASTFFVWVILWGGVMVGWRPLQSSI